MATKKRIVSKEDVEYGYVQACLQVAEIDWKEDQNTPQFAEVEDPSHSKQRKVNKIYPDYTALKKSTSNEEVNPVRSLFMSETNHFAYLVDEVVISIFSYLPRVSLCSAVQVCKRWKQLGYDEVLWRQVNLDSKHINKPGVIAAILCRGVKILRLSKAEVLSPIFLDESSDEYCNNFSLTHLDLTLTKFSKDVLASLLFSCVSLRNLSLEGGKVSLPEISAISDNANLSVLNLSQVVGLSTSAIDVITRKCSRLKSLNLAWTNQTRDCIRCISRCKQLEELNVSGLRGGINRQVMERLVLSCTDLKVLDLSDVTLQIGTLKLIADHLNHLCKLSISRCSDVKAEQLLDLTPLKSLSHLNLFGFLNSEALQRFTNTRPDIFINKESFSPIARPISTVSYEGRLWEQYVGFII